ncbi:MAG: glycosyltransferase family 4 protein [Pirellulaceae bacterium]
MQTMTVPTEDGPVVPLQLERPIRVLHLVHWMNRGGIESWLLTVLQHLSRKRCQMDVCCKGPECGELAPAVRETGSRLLLCPLGPAVVPFLHRFKGVLKRGGFDLLHVHTDVHSGPAVYAANSAGVPVVTTFHNTLFPPETRLTKCVGVRTLRSWYARRSMRYALVNSDQATGVSRGVVRAVERAAGQSPSACRVLYLGVRDPQMLSARQIAEYRTALQLRSDDRVVLHVGSFTERKNHGALIEVFHRIQRKCPNARLLLVGDGPLRGSIMRSVRALGLEERVRMLGLRNDVTALMQMSNVLVFPSINEGLSLALMEASATRLPIIASDIPGNREATCDGAAARLHDVTDLDAMAASAVALFRQPDAAKQLAELARKAYVHTFSIEASVTRLMGLYQQVLRNHGSMVTDSNKRPSSRIHR